MINLALRARSVRYPDKPYTATGLGDRIHGLTTGWVLAKANNLPVNIHLTKSKNIGGQFGNKPESWKEILGLFPKGYINLYSHAYEPTGELDWIGYLKDIGYSNPEIYWYGDHPGKYESIERINISKYLKTIPLLAADSVDINLPDKFVTVQWDSNDPKRTIHPTRRQEIVNRYAADGYDCVVVGGESTDHNLRWSLKHIAYAMSKADFHVGVDSGFMHLAMLYFPYSNIHLYNGPNGIWSHHLLRAIDNGSPLNYHYNS